MTPSSPSLRDDVRSDFFADDVATSEPQPRRARRRLAGVSAAVAVCVAGVTAASLFTGQPTAAVAEDTTAFVPLAGAPTTAPVPTASVPVPAGTPVATPTPAPTSAVPAAAPTAVAPAAPVTTARTTTGTTAAPATASATAAARAGSTARAAAPAGTGTTVAVAPAPLAVVAPAAVVSPAGARVPVESFGATGNATTDDTAALQRALDSVPAGTTLTFRAGATYLHSNVLLVRRNGTLIDGTGAVLRATNERLSTLRIDADDVTVTGLTLTSPNTTRRWDEWETTKVWVHAADRVTLRGISVKSTGGAGVAVTHGSGQFLLDRVTVADSRADGIHITGGSHDGRVVSPVTTNTGDDGVAVVSYMKDGVPCARIRIESPTVNGTTWGRGISVVGGNDVTYTNVTVRDTDAAGIYLGSEGDPYWTFPSRNVLVDGGTVTGANRNTTKDHGAVLVYGGNAGTMTSDITVRGLAVSGTRGTAPWDAGVLAETGAGVQRVTLQGLDVRNGARSTSWTNARPAVRLLSTLRDGVPVPDQRGW